MTRNRPLLPLLLALTAAAQAPFAYGWETFYNSDMAVITLMARRLLSGEFVWYYWGETYYGSLDAWLSAPLFAAFGAGPAVAQTLPLLYLLAFVAAAYFLLVEVAGPGKAFAACLLLGTASPYLTRAAFTVYAYPAVLALGALQLRLFLDLLKGKGGGPRWFCLGLAAGFSWYYFRLIFVFWAAAGLWWAAAHKPWTGKTSWAPLAKRILLLEGAPLPRWIKVPLAAAGVVAAAHWLLASVLWFHGDWVFLAGGHKVKLFFWPVLKTALRATAVCAAAAFHRPILDALRGAWRGTGPRTLAAGFLAGYLPALLAFFTEGAPRSPEKVMTLAGLWKNVSFSVRTLLPEFAGEGGPGFLPAFTICALAAALVWLLVRAVSLFRGGPRPLEPADLLPSLAAASLALGLSCRPLADTASLRYLLPLQLPLAWGLTDLLARMGRRGRWVAATVFGMVLLNGVFVGARRFRERPHPHPLLAVAERLEEKGIKGGYGDYWSTYLLTALSGERLIVTPIGGQNRRPAYLDFARSLDSVVWVGPMPPSEKGRISVEKTAYEIMSRDAAAGWELTYLKRETPSTPKN